MEETIPTWQIAAGAFFVFFCCIIMLAGASFANNEMGKGFMKESQKHKKKVEEQSNNVREQQRLAFQAQEETRQQKEKEKEIEIEQVVIEEQKDKTDGGYGDEGNDEDKGGGYGDDDEGGGYGDEDEDEGGGYGYGDDDDGGEGVCYGYDENTSKSFKRDLKKWLKTKYIHRRNSTSKMPGVKVISKSMTNERVFYGNIPKKFKNSYIDKEGKWKHGCDCSQDPHMNPFTNCKCAYGQYYNKSSDECVQIPNSCAGVDNYNDADIGKFYNLQHPLCNFKGGGGYADKGNKTNKNCCLSCNYKSFSKVEGGKGINPLTEYIPSYAENKGADIEGQNLLKIGEEAIGFNSRPKFFYPLWEKDEATQGKTEIKSESIRGVLLDVSEDGLGAATCEGSTQCGESGEDSFKTGYDQIKNNLFHCIRTSPDKKSQWGTHPKYGINGTAEEEAELKNPNDYGYEEARGWIQGANIGKSYSRKGYFSNPNNNSSKTICSDLYEAGKGSKGRVAAIHRKNECDKSSFVVDGKKYTCKGNADRKENVLNNPAFAALGPIGAGIAIFSKDSYVSTCSVKGPPNSSKWKY